MNILGIFSKKEIELLQNINIEIQDKAYEKEEIISNKDVGILL